MKSDSLLSIFNSITLITYLILVVVPFMSSKFLQKNNFLLLFLFSSLVSFLISSFSMYWSEELSHKLIYKIYNFEPYGMNDIERFSNVQPENRKAIQKIYENDFGIAWPLKLFISFFTVVIPYNCIVCGFNYFYRKKKH